MNFWKEKQINMMEHYWFAKEYSNVKQSCLSELESIVFVGEKLFSQDDKLKFIQYASNEICELFINNQNENYEIYLICEKRSYNKKSKVDRYKKLWKYIKAEWDINYEFGAEIEIEEIDYISYLGIAKSNISNIVSALELVAMRPSVFTVFISSKNYDLTEVLTEKLIKNAYEDGKWIDSNSRAYNLANQLGLNGDVTVRWGDGSVEAEIDLIYNPNFTRI